ncbi:MAG: hypothetical protein PUG76_06465 [Prevotellaceae bacterium]|nr:hypothetical protein [Prevotellaceae bacterium]
MTKDEIFQQLATSAKDELLAHHLLDALTQMQRMVELGAMGPESDAVQDILVDYQRMLAFARQGGADPLLEEQYLRLLQRALMALQTLRHAYRLRNKNDFFTQAYQEAALLHYNETEAEEGKESAEGHTDRVLTQTEDRYFDYIWTSGMFNADSIEEVNRMEALGDSLLLQHVANALTMALLAYFDPHKVRLLLRFSDSADEALSARALVGLAATCELHNVYYSLYPDLEQEVRDVAKRHAHAFSLIQHYSCIMRESERVQEEIQRNIIPDIIRAHGIEGGEGQTPGNVTLSMDDPALSGELRRRLAESFMKMNRLMRDGMDMNVGTFRGMARFPFFQSLSHWLLPYSPKFVDSAYAGFVDSLNMNDADKFSFALFLRSTPQEQAEKLCEQLANRPNNLTRRADESQLVVSIRNAMQALLHTLQHSQWADTWPKVLSGMNLLSVGTPLASVLSQDNHYLKRGIATYYTYGYFKQAEVLLESQLRLQGENVRILRRLAKCYEKQKESFKALKAVEKALVLDPQEPECLRMKLDLLGQFHKYEEQEKVIRFLLEKDADDADLLTRLGTCLMLQHRWKEAQQPFYKMEFAGQRVANSMRANAWCLLMQDNLQSAQRYYERLLSDSATATWEDRLNHGHTLWLQGAMTGALNDYQEALRAYAHEHSDTPNAMQPFLDDMPMLRRHGISDTALSIMHDLLVQML